MYKSYFNSSESQSCVIETDALSVFRKSKKTPSQIKHGMQQDQIAEIVSEKLIDYIKKQFDMVKNQR